MTLVSEESRLRLMAQVEVNADGCWIWQGVKTYDGYGRIPFKRETDGTRYRVATHRLSYMIHVGPIPEGLVMDHLCRVPPCCNPEHLEPVTSWENTLRGTNQVAVNARMTHCGDGHPLAGENLYIKPKRGDRACLICKRIDDRNRLRSLAGLPPLTAEEREAFARAPIAPVVPKPRRRRAPAPVDPTVDLEEMRRRPPAQRTHCSRGHPYAGDNLVVLASGHRECRECRNARQRERMAK